MPKDRYIVSITDTSGAHSTLGAVSGANLDEAAIQLGKLVRRKHEESLPGGLDLEGKVELTDDTGERVGEVSRIGEHILP